MSPEIYSHFAKIYGCKVEEYVIYTDVDMLLVIYIDVNIGNT